MRYNYILLVFNENFLVYGFGLVNIHDVVDLLDYFNSKSGLYEFEILKLGKYSLTKKFLNKYDMIFDYKCNV